MKLPMYSAHSLRLALLLLPLLVPDGVAGQETWRRTYGGSDVDLLNDVRWTSDGGYLVLGSTGSFGNGAGDMYLLKLDDTGNLIWSRTYGDAAVQSGVGCAIGGPGIIISGTTANGLVGGYDIRLLGVDDTGAQQWQRDIGTPDWDLCSDLEVVDEDIYLAGTTYGRGAGSADAFLVRANSLGDTLWCRTFGSIAEDAGFGVDVMSNGDVLLSGAVGIGTDDQNGFIAAFTSDGSPLWSTEVGGDSTDYISSTTELPGIGYACVGNTHSYSDVLQVWIVGLDPNGDPTWEQNYGSGGDTEMERIERRADGGLAMVGYNSAFNAGGKDMFLLLTDVAGGFQLGKNYGGSEDEVGRALRCTSDGGFILVGSTNTYGPGIKACYVIKAAANGETEDDTVYETFDPTGIEGNVGSAPTVFHPNPSSGAFNIPRQHSPGSWSLMDPTGRVQASGSLSPGTSSLEVTVPSGSYILRIRSQDGTTSTTRVTILRP